MTWWQRLSQGLVEFLQGLERQVAEPAQPAQPAPAATGEADPRAALIEACVIARQFEGLYLRPYLDPVGIPTLGYGATFYEDGVRVSLTDSPITRERAEQLLRWEMTKCVDTALRLCPQLRQWGTRPTAAIADFTFNLGSGRLSASTLRKAIAANDPAWAKRELMRWVYAGGKVLRGLVRRRTAECTLIG